MPASDWDVHYEQECPPWETGHPSTELQRVIAEDKIQPCRALELGCGTGVNAVWLAQQGFDVTAVDISGLALEKARARAAAAGVSVHFLQADIIELPDGGGPFEFFFDRGCYHAVRRENQPAYVRNVSRLMKPGSLGLILTGNAKAPRTPGPPVLAEHEFYAELEPTFQIVRLREFEFDRSANDDFRCLAWSCLLRRNAGA